MAIRRMISRDVDEFRAFQTRMTEVGRIRTGQFVTPEGKRGRPVKLDQFRLTSPNQDHIRTAAEVYGGEARQYQPQGGGSAQWEVIIPSNALRVWIINGQVIDPVYEMWGAGRTCTRRCDGVLNTVMQEPCVCNDPETRPKDPRQLCKITTRVNVMLPEVAGVNSWRLETHSENAAVEMAAPAVAGVVQAALVPVPATLYLRKEMRRERNHDKGTFETKDFYVPTFHIPLDALVLAAGPEALTAALTAAGAPAVLAAPEVRRELEAGMPVSAVPASAVPYDPAGPQTLQQHAQGGPVGISGELRAKILSDIEGQESLDGLDAIRDKLKARGINDRAVIDAWKSKRAAVQAAAEVAMREEPYLDREYQVGDTVTVGGIEFTKISNNPFPPGTPAAQAFEGIGADPHQDAVEQAQEETLGAEPVFEGIIEGDGLPMLPDRDYDYATELAGLMMLAGKRTPPLTTDGVRQILVSTYQLNHSGEATGLQIARLAEAMRLGIL